MATPKDGAAGYRFYRESEGTLSLADVNDMLTVAGYAPVSKRMYTHFRKLYRQGHTGYMPINRLDVLSASDDPIWGPRFRLGDAIAVDEPVMLTFTAGTRTIEIRAQATEMSEYGFLALIDAEALAPVLESAAEASALVHASFGRERTAVAHLVGWSVSQRRGRARARFVFEDFGALDRVDPPQAVPVARFKLTCGTADTALLLGEGAQLAYWAHEALEASRLGGEVLAGLRLPRPRLVAARFGSEWEIIGDLAVDAARFAVPAFAALKGPKALVDAAVSWEDLLERRDARKRRRDPVVQALERRALEAAVRLDRAPRSGVSRRLS